MFYIPGRYRGIRRPLRQRTQGEHSILYKVVLTWGLGLLLVLYCRSKEKIVMFSITRPLPSQSSQSSTSKTSCGRRRCVRWTTSTSWSLARCWHSTSPWWSWSWRMSWQSTIWRSRSWVLWLALGTRSVRMVHWQVRWQRNYKVTVWFIRRIPWRGSQEWNKVHL